ncbi:MAG TPA: BREX system ATP-binding domain-containing protein [Actinomycetes bacterium]|nr:BREX system ATP-binding domain-containing protein [Actinomycetes bacterium]
MTALPAVAGPGGDHQVAARRAVEALRAGVPSRAAVAALGAAQTEIEDRFVALLDQAREGLAQPARPGGLLVGGGFGSGKSHLLEHLTHLASQAEFVVSRVVVSKETPLHDPVKVFRAAAESAVLPRGYEQGSALSEAAAALDAESAAWAELSRWVNAPHSGMNERFAATLLLFGRFAANDGELAEAVIRFWSGDPIRVADLRRRLRETAERYALPPVAARELARQRFRFAARLFAAAGYAGWVVLFDEVELIGRYSVLQRGRSYAELSRWVRGDDADPGLPLVAVLAMTDDFEAAVVSGKNDREVVPAKFRARQTHESDEIAAGAESGMRIIDREMVLLTPPDAAELDRAYTRLKELHGEAFGWGPPDVPGLERLAATRMRQYVRAWINEWDLIRLDPEFTPDTEVADEAIAAASGYQERSELEDDA